MEFHIRAATHPAKLAILAGAFYPPTRAHLALAEAALALVDEVVFVLPRQFPHKEYCGAGFEERLELLRAALAGQPRFALASTPQGLFIDLAREARRDYGQDTELFLLCGRDAAERIVSWDYGDGDGIRKQLEEFQLIVASRGRSYEPPPELRARVISIGLSHDEVSSSEIRRRIRAGERWQDLAPAGAIPLIEARLDLWSGE